VGCLNQVWELIRVSDDTFKLRAAHSGLVLNLPNSSTKPGNGMWQWTDDGTSAGLWKLESKGDGWFFIRSASSNQVLAVDNMSKDNGGSVTQWDNPGSDDHFWRFERVGVRLHDWYVMDMGNVKGSASTKIDGNTFSLTANNFDVWNTKDSCRYVCKEVAGDWDFVAQLTEMNDIADWSKTGIMVRNSILPSSRNIYFGFSGRKGFFHQHRATDEAVSERNKSLQEGLKGPRWIKLTRRGSTFTSYYSVDGNTWTQAITEEMNLQNEAVVGLAASSNNAAALTLSARFENVSLKQVQ
jgi:regulation of enolase protein 1 (concanavalin A-like superfamily)